MPACGRLVPNRRRRRSDIGHQEVPKIPRGLGSFRLNRTDVPGGTRSSPRAPVLAACRPSVPRDVGPPPWCRRAREPNDRSATPLFTRPRRKRFRQAHHVRFVIYKPVRCRRGCNPRRDFLSADQKADILCDNAARFLRLDNSVCLPCSPATHQASSFINSSKWVSSCATSRPWIFAHAKMRRSASGTVTPDARARSAS